MEHATRVAAGFMCEIRCVQRGAHGAFHGAHVAPVRCMTSDSCARYSRMRARWRAPLCSRAAFACAWGEWNVSTIAAAAVASCQGHRRRLNTSRRSNRTREKCAKAECANPACTVVMTARDGKLFGHGYECRHKTSIRRVAQRASQLCTVAAVEISGKIGALYEIGALYGPPLGEKKGTGAATPLSNSLTCVLCVEAPRSPARSRVLPAAAQNIARSRSAIVSLARLARPCYECCNGDRPAGRLTAVLYVFAAARRRPG